MNKKAKLQIAPPYSRELIEKLQAGFSALCGREVEFEIVEDPALVGGFIVFVDGKKYDSSYQTKLASFKAGLRE